jgi:signal transduction histidine kinase
LERIIRNLTLNALQYQDQKKLQTFIQFRISPFKNGVIVEIKDNGIGIPFHIQNHLFRMFFKGTNLSNGLGLGLYTVKQCVDKLQGYITVDSKEMEGTTFTVFIPNLN